MMAAKRRPYQHDGQGPESCQRKKGLFRVRLPVFKRSLITFLLDGLIYVVMLVGNLGYASQSRTFTQLPRIRIA